MPLYLYSCPSCKITVEELRPASRADDPVFCPVCNTACARGLASFFVSRGCKESDPARCKPTHPAGCPCCAGRRPKPAFTPQTPGA